MPVDGYIATEEGVDLTPLLQHKIFTEGMMKLYDIGARRMTWIRKAANSTGVAKAHGNNRGYVRSSRPFIFVGHDLALAKFHVFFVFF